MSAQGKSNREQEVLYGRRDGNVARTGRGAVSLHVDGARLVYIDARAFGEPSLAAARFLVAQGHLIEELATLGTKGDRRE